MKTIFKYPLEITDRQTLYIPRNAKLLDVQVQRGIPCLWALVDTQKAKEPRKIQIFGTGHPAVEAGIYIATFQTGPLVFEAGVRFARAQSWLDMVCEEE